MVRVPSWAWLHPGFVSSAGRHHHAPIASHDAVKRTCEDTQREAQLLKCSGGGTDTTTMSETTKCGISPTGSDVARRARGDQGFSLVEILVSIVLMGTVMIAVLGALQISVTGSRVERDHARAHQWLQSAIGAVQAAPRVSCDPPFGTYSSGENNVRNTYQNVIRGSAVLIPPGWSSSQLEIVPSVKVWDGDQYLDPNTAPKACYDSNGFRLQLITIRVESPDGEIIESVEVVKND